MSVRRAATVLVLRPAGDGAATVEVLLVRRHSRASFMANAYVFPGGAVDAQDWPAAAGQAPHLDEHSAEGRACRQAALRELHEEVGLQLPAAWADDPARLPRFARWLTPSAEPRRFDTDFFLAALPPDQTPVADAREVFDLRWLTPAGALAEAAAGLLRLPPPTHASLWELQAWVESLQLTQPPGSGARVLAALLHLCANKATPRITPKLVPASADAAEAPAMLISLPWDAGFADLPGEGEPLPAPALPALAGAPAHRSLPRPPLRYQVTAAGFHPQWAPA